MRRDLLLLAELTSGHDAADIDSDRDRRDAVLWNFTVLGEAVAQVSDETRSSHPEVKWGAPVRMRNRIVHDYWSIDVDVLTATARDDLPAFLEAVRAIELPQ